VERDPEGQDSDSVCLIGDQTRRERVCGKEDRVFCLWRRQCWYVKTDDLALVLASRRVSAGTSLWNVHCRLQYKYKILTPKTTEDIELVQ